MSEKVLHRVAKTDALRGWSVKQDRDDGPLHARYDDINYGVDRYELVKELARLAARMAELEGEKERLRDEADRQTKAKECYEERLARKEADNAKLRACVEKADAEIAAWREWCARIAGDERVCGWVHREDYGLYCLLADPPCSDIPYDAARAEVDK